MRILKCHARNFGSYKELDLDLTQAGLTLIRGATGSGKSTIPDALAWALFGVTGKDGAADDVRNWQASDQVTEGIVILEIMTVVRRRGKGSNDLYFYDQTDSTPIRGKDIPETQRLIEQRLGVTADLFIAASYYHEFSPTGSFFTAKAKDRRSLFEKLADLDLPKKLAERSSEAKKETNKAVNTCEIDVAKAEATIQQLESAIVENDRMSSLYVQNKDKKINDLKFKALNYDKTRESKLERILARLEEIDKVILPNEYFQGLLGAIEQEAITNTETCPTCGTQKHKKHPTIDRYTILKDKGKNDLLLQEQNSLLSQLEDAQSEINTYQHQIDQLEAEPNPYIVHETQLTQRLIKYEDHLTKCKSTLGLLNARLTNLSYLYDLSSTLRGELLKNAVKRVQNQTNAYLEKYFDSEMRVLFELDDDKLEVTANKSGYPCNYKQLSKGQRGLLKLCFSLAVMSAASDTAGIHFDNLFFDEALDGLDESLKIKAFGLIEELSTTHSSVFVIDHSTSFQNMFSRQLEITLEGDFSKIEEL